MNTWISTCGPSGRVRAVALCAALTMTVSAAGQLPPPPDLTMLAPWWTLHGSNLTGIYAYPSGGWNGTGYVRPFGYGHGYGVGTGTPWWSNWHGSGGYYGAWSRPQPVWWTFPRAATNPAAVDALAKAEQVYGTDHAEGWAAGHRHCPICDGGRGLEYWDLNVPGHPPRWLPPQSHPHVLPFGPAPGAQPPAPQEPKPRDEPAAPGDASDAAAQ